MRTSKKRILGKLLSMTMALLMVMSLVEPIAYASDQHDHEGESVTVYNLDYLTSDFDLDAWTAEKDTAVQAIEDAHDHEHEEGCVYDAAGNRVCTVDSALCALGGDHEECIYDAEGNMICCDLLGVDMTEEPSLWEKAWDSVVAFFDMSNLGVVAYASNCPNRPAYPCNCSSDYNCSHGCHIVAGVCSDGGGGGGSSDDDDSGGGGGGGGGGSTCTLTHESHTEADFERARQEGRDDVLSKVEQGVSNSLSKSCAYCRSTAHVMKDCDLYKKTLPQNVSICSFCGVVESATINGVAWTYPHAIDCKTYDSLWDDVTDDGDVTIENKGSQGVYINGQLIAGTNFDASKVGTGGGGVKVADDQGYSVRASATQSGSEATVLTYPRSLDALVNKQSTGSAKNDYYDDPSWKTIMGSTRRSYSSTDSGIWDYGGSKYRIAKVIQNTKDPGTYVLVRIPSNWLERLKETNPKAQGKVPTPVGRTWTETVTGTTTSTSTSRSNTSCKEGSKDLVDPSKVADGAFQPTYNGTSTTASQDLSEAYTRGGGHQVGSDGKSVVDSSGKTVSNSWTDSSGNSCSYAKNSDGTIKMDEKTGQPVINKSKSSTSTSTYTYTVTHHEHAYAYFYTDICKTGSVTFSGSYSYDVSNNNSYSGYTSGKDLWGTSTTGGSTNLGSSWKYSSKDSYVVGDSGYSSSTGSVYKPGAALKDPVYTTQPVKPGASTYSASSPYSTSSSQVLARPYSTSTSSKYAYDYDLNDYYTSKNTSTPSFDFEKNYNEYKKGTSMSSNNTITGSGSSVHVKTQFSCCSSNTGSTTEPHSYAATTYTDMGTDRHRVERICGDCGHIDVSFEDHTTNQANCPKCGRAMGRTVNWHWYNSAEGPVITQHFNYFYTTLWYPPIRGRMDYTFTGFYTDWGGVGNYIDPDDLPMYVNVMPGDFYASWAFIIQQDFEAPNISVQFYKTEADAKSGKKPIEDITVPVDELWVRVVTLDYEGHSVEAHKQFVGDKTKDKVGSAHYSWHKDNPLWTSGLIEDVESWTGSVQQVGDPADQWNEATKENPYVFKVTRNDPVSIIARDAWGNTRTHIIQINNFDMGAPNIAGFMQSNESWTDQPVRVYVSAEDDQALAAQPYLWEYTLNSENNATVHSTNTWTSLPYMDMPDSGYVRVKVKDSVGKVTESAPQADKTQWYAVSNIDKIPLGLQGAVSSNPNSATLNAAYELSTTEKVAATTGVTITLNITDPQDTVTHKSSGLAQTPIQWIGSGLNSSWTTKRSVTVHSNGTYIVKLKDAVGNVSTFNIKIDNIVTNGPSISISGKDVDGRDITTTTWWKGPVTLSANAVYFGEAGERPDKMSYSWDGGVTWTQQKTFIATTNGIYRLMIRDRSGTTAESFVNLTKMDSTAPVVGMYLYKGVPDDWTERFGSRECTVADYVWKMRIEIEDPGADLADITVSGDGTAANPSRGSGIYSIQYQWLGDYVIHPDNVTDADRNAVGKFITVNQLTEGTNVTTKYFKHTFDVPRPGTYQITVIDKAGNKIQVEKVAQWTDLGEGTDGPNPNVPITWPDTHGGPSGTDDTQHGTAGLPFDSNLDDLIFGEDRVYNKITGEDWPYPNPNILGQSAPNNKGIPVHFEAEVTRNRYATGYVTYNNVKYTVFFTNPDSNGLVTDLWRNNVKLSDSAKVNGTGDKVLGTGNKLYCYAFIPLSAFHQDVKNARIYVTINEWDNEACTQLLKTGTENLYTSVQLSKPTITYTYNRPTDVMTVVATSALSGIKSVTYQYDDQPEQPYTGPFIIGDPKPEWIYLRATDNLGNVTVLPIRVSDLGLNGSTGGVGSLPQNDTGLGGDTSSYHSSNRAADIYIIGGTRGNTDQHPAGDVFDKLLGNSATPSEDEP